MNAVGGSPAAVVLLVAAAMAASGCFGSVNCSAEQGATGQKTICNGTVFTYTLQGSPPGKSESFTWENDKGLARVSAAFQGSGSVVVTIKDAAGKQVYARQHGEGQTAESTSTAGAKGAWTIIIQVTALSGQVALSVTPTSA